MSQSVTFSLAATLRATCSTHYSPQAPLGLGPSGNDQERKKGKVSHLILQGCGNRQACLKATLRALRGLDPGQPIT